MTCTNCSSSDISEDSQHGELVCENCGCVQPEKLFSEIEEKRNFMEDGIDRRRTHLVNPLYGLAASSTIISNHSKKNGFVSMDSSFKLQKLNSQLASKEVRSDMKTIFDIHKNLDELAKEHERSIKNIVVLTAKSLGEELLKQLKKQNKTIRGLRSKECAVALLYFGVQIHQVGKSLKDLNIYSAKKSNGDVINETKVTTFIKIIKNNVNMDNQMTNPKDMIRHIVESLHQPFEVTKRATELYEDWMTRHSSMLCSRKPSTIAGAAISIITEKMKTEPPQSKPKNVFSADYDFNDKITLADIALVATVAEGTLKNFLKEIKDRQHALVKII